MQYSIIIINYNTPQLTFNCIKSILALPDPEDKEIIVIDNASKDNSPGLFRAAFKDRITIIENKENKGFSYANNQGAKIAKHDFLLFLNSDTIITDDIFNSATETFKENKDVAILTPQLRLEDGTRQPFAYGYFPTLLRLITRKTKKDIPIKENDKTIEVDWVSGCALTIRKDVFQEVGGFDESFFLYFEDVDLCKRVKNKNYKVLANLQTSITHLGGKSIEQHSTRKKFYYESQDYYFRKHASAMIFYFLKLIKIIKMSKKWQII